MSFDYKIQDFVFNKNTCFSIKEYAQEHYIFPTVYIIYCKKSKIAYIGETTNILNRLKQHLLNNEKNKMPNIKVIFSKYFNKSSVLDIESNLIKYMSADNKFKLLNANDGISNHHYYQKNEYDKTFKSIWKNLQFDKLVNEDILNIENSNLFKYSPYKQLSQDQYNAIREYFYNITSDDSKHSTFIQGSAGTGKTILAVYIIKLLSTNIDDNYINKNYELSSLLQLAKEVRYKLTNKKEDIKIALVIPMTSLRKTIKKVFKSIYGLHQDMVVGPNEVSKVKYDLLIVDEAHRLKRRKNITGYKEFDKTNKYFNLDKLKGNELDWVILSSNYSLYFYDKNQSIRPSDITEENFNKLIKKSSTIELNSQLRVIGGNNYIEFVNDLLTNSCSSKWDDKNYELVLFSSIKNMIKELEEKEKVYGLTRLISGYSWKWVSRNTNQADVTLDGIDLHWNKTNKDWINSTNDLKEMGCIHTTQGYDLNYAGIIFGKDITYNKETNKIQTIKEHYFDRNGKAGINEIELHDYIINIYKTIMYRGIKGTYIYCYNKDLEDYFKNYINTYSTATLIKDYKIEEYPKAVEKKLELV